MKCRKKYVSNPTHDYCFSCYSKQREEDEDTHPEDHFENNLDTNLIHTVYIMIYGNKNKIGYTGDLHSRIFELKRKYPNNKLVYFREFMTETQARDFEVWLKKISKRELNKFITNFMTKINKLEAI